ncbi:ATP-dependent Zn proteases [Jannaschia pohangensis]|uniref:ATP-dependent Zn proteases n=2 Tax=Jannaschia pohangensis TaxID=390807 RepID=A0A1I3MWS9_9RHOB|nr:ATP-dependent Zn proteases [Jannaschia pohangensis]
MGRAPWPGRFLKCDPVQDADRTSSLPWHEIKSLDSALMLGATVVVQLEIGASMPEQLRAIAFPHELTLPVLSRDDIAAMLRACGTPVPDACDETGAAGSSAAADMTYLTTTHLAHIWAGETAAEVFARLDAVEACLHQGMASEALSARTSGSEPSPRLRDIHGLGRARDKLERVVADVEDWKDGALEWPEVGASFLLHGPAGVGKTSVAHAIANEIGGEVIDLSYTTVQAAGHLGKMLAALDAGVERARDTAPAVVLVDEADCLSDRADTSDPHAASYRRSVVNGYLTRLTMLADSPGVVVVLATNHPDQLDPALIRAGRCDHHIALHRPDRTALGLILRDNLGGRAALGLETKAEWTAALDGLAGGTGADAAHLARESIAITRTRIRNSSGSKIVTVEAQDLLAAVHAIEGTDPVTPADPHRMAIHEAGHLVVGHVLNRPAPVRAWLGPRGAGIQAPRVRVYILAAVRDELVSLLAGRAAEMIFCEGVSSGGGDGPTSDLAQATRLASRAAGEWHLIQDDPLPVWQPHDHLTPSQARAMSQLLEDAQTDACRMAETWRADITRVADALMRERDLNAEQLQGLLGQIRHEDTCHVRLVH